MLSLKTHNILDYVGGVLLLFAPAIFGFSEIDAARSLFIFAGIALIGYSLLTKYPYSVVKAIPLGVHMVLDVAIGAAVILGPWIFGYRPLITVEQEVLHYALGLGVFALVAFTRVKTSSEALATTTFATFDRDRKAS